MLTPTNLTNSIEESPSGEANRFSASEEISRVIWNPKVLIAYVTAHHVSLF
jgi:hypothetical protein